MKWSELAQDRFGWHHRQIKLLCDLFRFSLQHLSDPGSERMTGDPSVPVENLQGVLIDTHTQNR